MIRLTVSFAVAVCVATIAQYVPAQDLVTTHWNADAKNDILKVGKFDEPGENAAAGVTEAVHEWAS